MNIAAIALMLGAASMPVRSFSAGGNGKYREKGYRHPEGRFLNQRQKRKRARQVNSY